MKIISMFHQGSEKYVEVVDLPRLDADAVQTALAGVSMVNVMTNPDADKAIADLVAQREASLGWCRIWVAPSEGDRVEVDYHTIERTAKILGTVDSWHYYGVDRSRTVPVPHVVPDEGQGVGILTWSVSNPKGRILTD